MSKFFLAISRMVVSVVFVLIYPQFCLAVTLGHDAAVTAIAKRIEGLIGRPPAENRTSAQGCFAGGVPKDSPFWQGVLAEYVGYPVQDCSPIRPSPNAPNGKLVGRAFLLLPNAIQTAEWIVSACESQGLTHTDLKACGTTLLDYINIQNNFQFVIAGVIHEEKSHGYRAAEKANAKCVQTRLEEVLYSFRDGITVRLQGQPRTSFRSDAKSGCRPEQPSNLENILVTPPVYVAEYGRIAGLPRSVYKACTGKSAVSDDEWRKIVRSSFLEAWADKRYSLLELVAKALVKPTRECHF